MLVIEILYHFVWLTYNNNCQLVCNRCTNVILQMEILIQTNIFFQSCTDIAALNQSSHNNKSG